jgi:low affinity Fe/Cu permease
MPTEVSGRVGFFDRFAGHAARFASRAPFFAGCVLLILIWAPTIFVLSFDTSQLLINTATTIVTFLLVALLQNSQTRNDQATQHKLNAIADGLADLMERFAHDDPGLRDEIDELKSAVGLEDRESTTGDSKKQSTNGQSAKAGARS